MLSVVFDMDGVLFDTQRLYLDAWYEVGRIMGLPDISEVARPCMGMNRNDQRRMVLAHYGDTFDYDRFMELKDEIFNGYLAKGLILKPGVREILTYLKDIGAKVAVASSSRVESVTHHLKETELTGYFSKIIGGDLVEHSKPLPDIYLKACEELGVAPEETYAVEDSYNGVRAAAAAGMKTIMIPDCVPPNDETNAIVYRTMGSLVDFLEYLKEIRS